MSLPTPANLNPAPPASAPTQPATDPRYAFSKLNFAFALMSVIPLLICGYLITEAFLHHNTFLEGLTGIFLSFAILFALLGLLFGRHIIQHLVQELVRANAQLERYSTMQMEFMSHVAHDFRAPLAIIKGAMENLADGMHGPLTADQMEPVMMGQREVNRLKRLVSDLLDVAQIESGRLRLKVEALDLRDLLRATVEAFKVLAVERKLQLTAELPADPARMTGDPHRLGQVFANLVNNAIKFTDTGRVTVRLSKEGSTYQVVVEDTGMGIAGEDLERIFQKFERAGEERREGFGLGLPIVKAIVELHQGRLWVESDLGKGSRFFVRLPIRVSP